MHWTWGLSFTRTSPAHGTAFDIAWKNKADPAGMKAAIIFAAKLQKRRLEKEAGTFLMFWRVKRAKRCLPPFYSFLAKAAA